MLCTADASEHLHSLYSKKHAAVQPMQFSMQKMGHLIVTLRKEAVNKKRNGSCCIQVTEFVVLGNKLTSK